MRGDRTTPYKEDSTKGSSMINPLNYKGDVLVQVWVDSRVLATLSRWLEDHGTYTVHMSQVVRRPLEILVDLLTNSGDAELIDNTIEARELLNRRYGIDLNRGGRGTKNIMHNMTLSMRREEIAEAAEKDRRVYDVNRPLRTNQNAGILSKVEEAKKKYKELYPDGSQHLNEPSIFVEDPLPRESIVNERVVKNENAADLVKTMRVERELQPLREKGNSRELIEERIRRADEESKRELDAINSFDPMTLLSKAKKE